MLEQYSLSMPGAVYSGRGALERIREIAEGRFKKAAVFTDRGVEQAGLLAVPMEQLRAAGAETVVITDLPAEPSCDEAQDIIDRFRETGADLIVAVGGGSVMDVAKLASIGEKRGSHPYGSHHSRNRFRGYDEQHRGSAGEAVEGGHREPGHDS